MKMNDFAKSAAARNAAREPLRATIREHWADVRSALDQGATKKSISAELKAQFSAKVGSMSGFNAALQFVMAEMGYVRPVEASHTVLSKADVSVVNVTAVTDKRRRMWGDDA
jgi:hypothetical protein